MVHMCTYNNSMKVRAVRPNGELTVKIIWTVSYVDGTSGEIECEKPHGAHAYSTEAVLPAIVAAEASGKQVLAIGHGLDAMNSRESYFEHARIYAPDLLDQFDASVGGEAAVNEVCGIQGQM
jgi:hypothetical protein